MNTPFLSVLNGMPFETANCPVLHVADLHEEICRLTAAGGHLSALFGVPGEGCTRIYAHVSDTERGRLLVASADVHDQYPALTPVCPQAALFEREIHEQTGVVPEGHPWLKPVRFVKTTAGVTDFFTIEGDGVHEVAVGPVHAGVIEPGHFRFQCHGETVHHLEIALGYQHRGVERALAAGPDNRTVHYLDTLSGDTTIGHATAGCRLMEAFAGTRVPPAAQAIRGVAAELERLACHVGDLGALAGDVGFLPTMNYCGRIRGELLNLTAALCGNRFGRGLVRPGGVSWPVELSRSISMVKRLEAIEKDARNAIELLWTTPSVLARFEGVGTVSASTAREIGMVGLAARASGLRRDVREQYPYSIYRFRTVPTAVWHTGDCFARAWMRWLEVQQSFTFVREQLQGMPAGPHRVEPCGLRPGLMAVSLVEGWRGEICHVASTGPDGQFSFYKVVDPSFHNWFGLACALREQQISDFPLCNKSFNLSYCGHDL
jgi:Ni,Fe-hydrogenase III large subunit